MASNRKFDAGFIETFKVFLSLVQRCMGPSIHDFVVGVASRVTDSAETREWLETIRELSNYCAGADEIPNSSFTAHLDIDSGDEDRLVELLIWQLFGTICTPNERISCPPLIPPRSLVLGGRGVLSIPLDFETAQAVTLDWREDIPRLQTDDGRWTKSSHWVSHTVVPGGPVIPIGDRALTAARLQDSPIVSGRRFSEEWALHVSRAITELEEYSPQAGLAVKKFVTHALPLLCSKQTIASASRQEALGLVFLPARGDMPDQLAECLLHEAMHQLLFRLESCARLFAADSPADSLFYSPWRTDRRPLRMTLHGCFVFTAVADMYLWLAGSPRWGITPEVAHSRAFQRHRESAIALQVVKKYGKTTQIGDKVISAIEADLSNIERRLAPLANDVERIENTVMNHLGNRVDYLH